MPHVDFSGTLFDTRVKKKALRMQSLLDLARQAG